jgi:protein gp37
MAKDSKIEWTHHTFNPWWGCERVSPACKNCYAETWAHRLGLDLWSRGAPRRTLGDSYWRQPLSWNRTAKTSNRRDRVFCASMADVFEDRRDLDAIRARLWSLIAETPNLDWLLLTKRPQCVERLVPWGDGWPLNVWLGTTIENQRWADKRLPYLLAQPAAVHFVSCEPLLGSLDIKPWLVHTRFRKAIAWVIAGGESGHRARPMNPEWARALRDQCQLHGVPYHFKQWGNWRPIEGPANNHRIRVLNSGSASPILMENVGKKAAGRELDGQQWDGLPCLA